MLALVRYSALLTAFCRSHYWYKNCLKLKLILTAGIGSDHVDLNAAAEAGLTVAEVSGTYWLPHVHNGPEWLDALGGFVWLCPQWSA